MDIHEDGLRQLEKAWDYWMIAAAMIVSFLGTFTSTQLMIQARLSPAFSGVLVWIVIIAITFGFCAVWSLHFVAMLACKVDLAIGLRVDLTLISAILAVLFTFAAMGVDLLWENYHKDSQFQEDTTSQSISNSHPDVSMPLLRRDSIDDGTPRWVDPDAGTILEPGPKNPSRSWKIAGKACPGNDTRRSTLDFDTPGFLAEHNTNFSSLEPSWTLEGRNSLEAQASTFIAPKSYRLKSMAGQGNSPNKNPFVATYESVRSGICWKAIVMGFVWSLSVTGMHYSGLAAMKIPGGFLRLEPFFVVLSAFISWAVCIMGYVYMINIEAHFSQQVLFSILAACGIAGMHFTGMRATTFWSREPPAVVGGYPAQLPIAICSIAILTCMLAMGLLAHNATVSRNKLAEIVWTRRKLWRAMAQKDNAEAAAAARTNFIALASHEIRTPLHHLQGYSDLLSRTDLSEEGRQLLSSIQGATKTLSLITNNVLDWSKLESDTDALCRPIPLDLRSASESILELLPHKEDDANVEMLVVISPNVPKTLLLDETYIHRILMNLLSNALKFTNAGYIMLSIDWNGSDLLAKVKDTGAGIPQSFIGRLFEPFSQAQTRGSQRGTGLGLSIVKQLLDKMDGSIAVESYHAEPGSDSSENGTVFTITIPTRLPSPTALTKQSPFESDTVAILYSGNERTLDGLKMAWEIFGYQVLIAKEFSELSNPQIKYIWTNPEFLQQNTSCLRQLMRKKKWKVLVPFEGKNSVQHLPEILSASNFVPLPKPLMWHTIQSRIAIACRASSNIAPSRSLDVISGSDPVVRPKQQRPVSSNSSPAVNVLLVEDNPINRKLGHKMLSSLGYTVLFAHNGEEAISQILLHDSTIDMILMDQSMPVKDGVTATREIRVLEGKGRLGRRHPIVAITAVVDTESRALFKEAGADEFLAKPLSLGTLEGVLSTFLRVEGSFVKQ